MFQLLGRQVVRFAASAMVLGFLGTVAGCGGGQNGGTAPTPPTGGNPPAAVAPSLKTIEVTPSSSSAAAGTSRQFTATGVYTDNSTKVLTSDVTWASSDAAVVTVSNAAGSNGAAIAVNMGNAVVSATSGSVMGQTTLTVTDATLVSIEVTPPAPSVAAGTSQQFTATGLYTDNSTQDLTAQVSWTSSEGSVATVSNTAGSNGLASTAGAGSSVISAASGTVSGAATLTVTEAVLVAIEVTPASSSVANGTTQQFTATGLYTDDSTQDLTTQVTWASSDAAVATLSNDAGSMGLATAVGAGSTTVSASSGGVSGQTTLAVTEATLVSIEVSPLVASVANGLTQQFTATGLYSDDSTQDITADVTWASSDGTVATVSNAADSHGLATTTGVGSTTVSASSGELSGETSLTVTDATLVSIEVSPAIPTIPNGSTQQFTATGLYTDDSTQDLTTQVTWASSDAAVATVGNDAATKGLATSAGSGSTTVSAASGEVSGETTLTVTDATLVSIEVTPATPSVASGLTQQFTATGHYTDDSTQDITTQVTWASSDGAVAVVSNAAGTNGLASTSGLGSTTVSATSEGMSGAATLTVTDATLVSIEVSPSTSSVANGLTQQFTATGTYTDGSTQDLTTTVLWASSDGTVSTVSNAAGSNGLATTAGLGSTTVSATSGGVSDESTLTVTDATLAWIDVSPPTPSIASGLTQQFTATGHYTDNSTQDITAQVTWASSDGSAATVSNTAGAEGLATGLSAGSSSVSATSGGVTGQATLTVTSPLLLSVDVSPQAPSVESGQTQQFTATGHYTDNSTQDITTEVTWSSSDAAVATVSNATGSNGLTTAVAEGSTTVSASSGAVSGATTLTVTAPLPTVNDLLAQLLLDVIGVGPGSSLANKVLLVQAYLAVPDVPSACSKLDDFQAELVTLSGKSVPAPLASQLTADSEVIEAAIPCN